MPSHKAGYGALSHTRSYNFARQLHMKINESASFQSCYLRESCGTDINQEAVETFKDGGGGRQQKKKPKPKQTSANKVQEVQEIWGWMWGKYT